MDTQGWLMSARCSYVNGWGATLCIYHLYAEQIFLGILSTCFSSTSSDMLIQREEWVAIRLVAKEKVSSIKAGQWIRIFFIETEISGLKLSNIIKKNLKKKKPGEVPSGLDPQSFQSLCHQKRPESSLNQSLCWGEKRVIRWKEDNAEVLPSASQRNFPGAKEAQETP